MENEMTMKEKRFTFLPIREKEKREANIIFKNEFFVLNLK